MLALVLLSLIFLTALMSVLNGIFWWRQRKSVMLHFEGIDSVSHKFEALNENVRKIDELFTSQDFPSFEDFERARSLRSELEILRFVEAVSVAMGDSYELNEKHKESARHYLQQSLLDQAAVFAEFERGDRLLSALGRGLHHLDKQEASAEDPLMGDPRDLYGGSQNMALN